MTAIKPVIWTPEMDAALRDLRRQNVGVVRCAGAVGVAPDTLAKRLDALGLPRFPVGRQRREAVA